MPMQWKDESYVRLYTRDTNNWLLLSWEARAVLVFLMRKVARSGTFEIDPEMRGLAKALDMPLDVVQRSITELTRPPTTGGTPTLVIEGSTLFLPNFVEAQEVRRETGAERQAAYRARSKLAKERDLGQMALPMAASPASPASPVSAAHGAPHSAAHGAPHGAQHVGDRAPVTDSVTRVVTRNASAVLSVPCSAVQGSVRGTASPREDAGPPPACASHDAPKQELAEEPVSDPEPQPEPPKSTESRPQKSTGTSLPASWTPPDRVVEDLRRELGVDAAAALEQFRDYWSARPGRAGKSLDWVAQFRADVRRFKKDLPPWPPRAHATMSPRKAMPTEPHPTAHLAPEARKALVGGMVAQLEAAIGPMNEPRVETHVRARDVAFASYGTAAVARPPKEPP